LSKQWHDLYSHGQHLNTVCKRFFTEFKKAQEEGNDDLMLIYAEALRKTTMNCVDVAKVVLQVEEIIKGKRIEN